MTRTLPTYATMPLMITDYSKITCSVCWSVSWSEINHRINNRNKN